MVWTTARYAAQFNGGDDFEPGGYLTDYYTDEAIKVIEANRNRPFPVPCPQGIQQPAAGEQGRLRRLSRHRKSCPAGIRQHDPGFDRSVGRIVKALEDNGLVTIRSSYSPAITAAPAISACRTSINLSRLETRSFPRVVYVPFMAQWPSAHTAGLGVRSRHGLTCSDFRRGGRCTGAGRPPQVGRRRPAAVCAGVKSTACRTGPCSGGRATSRRCWTTAEADPV